MAPCRHPWPWWPRLHGYSLTTPRDLTWPGKIIYWRFPKMEDLQNHRFQPLPQFVTARCVAFSVSLAFLASTNAARVVWVPRPMVKGPKHVFWYSWATALKKNAAASLGHFLGVIVYAQGSPYSRIILGDPCNNYVKKPVVQTLNPKEWNLLSFNQRLVNAWSFSEGIENVLAGTCIDPKTCPAAIRDCPLRGLFSFLGFLGLHKRG